jgi:hypothetical protein
MVRVVIRPWVVSRSRWAIGVWRQGSASRAANRVGWFCLTVRTNSAPRECRYSAWARWVWRASYGDVLVMPTPLLGMLLAAVSRAAGSA